LHGGDLNDVFVFCQHARLAQAGGRHVLSRPINQWIWVRKHRFMALDRIVSEAPVETGTHRCCCICRTG
jgi:hypothetical protein